MIGSFGTGISTGVAISSAHTATRAASTTISSRHRRYPHSDNGSHSESSFSTRSSSRSRDRSIGILILLLAGLAGLGLVALLVSYVEGPAEISSGRVNPEAIERARQREIANQTPPPTYLYSQKVPTKILYVGSYKHISARVRNQATGMIDSVYLCKKHCGLRYKGTGPGSIVNITWHSYRDEEGIYQRVDAGELGSLYR